MYERWKQWQYYIIIAVVSLIALFFLPMIGSEADVGWKLPNTFVGWFVFVISKLLVAGLNLLIFHCFTLQAKVNIAENERFKEATAILRETSDSKLFEPKSPDDWFKNEYSKKGASIFLTSIVSAVGLTQAVLTFDMVSMLTYLFTVVMGIIFGILQMNRTELYWTQEYWEYAMMIKRKASESIQITTKTQAKTHENDEGNINVYPEPSL